MVDKNWNRKLIIAKHLSNEDQHNYGGIIRRLMYISIKPISDLRMTAVTTGSHVRR